MSRFALAVVYGAAGAAIAYAAGANPIWATGVGLVVAVAAWALNDRH